MSIVKKVLDIIWPRKVAYRKIRLGPCAGFFFPLDLRRRSDLFCFLGVYEQPLHPFLPKLIKHGDICYDIGSDRGYYALALAKLTQTGTIYSFEAHPELSASLHTTISLNPQLEAEVIPETLFIDDHVNLENGHVSVDYLVYNMNYKVPNVFKIDVDGGELAVLQGAQQVIKEHRPIFIIEVHSYELEERCIALLEMQNYHIQVIDQKPVFFFIKEWRRIELNRWFVAVPKTSNKTSDK